MLAAASRIVNDIHILLEPLYYELLFAGFFAVGWCICSRLCCAAKPRVEPRRKSAAPKGVHVQAEELSDAFSAGRKDDVIRLWRQTSAAHPTSPESLRMVVWAMAFESPSTLVEEVVRHLRSHRRICNASSAAAAIEGLMTVSKPDLLEELHRALRDELRIQESFQVHEALLGGYAAAGDVDHVGDLISNLRSIGQKLTARGHALIIKGFLQNDLLDAALAQIRAMRLQGFFVPPFAMGQLFKVASRVSRCPEIFSLMLDAEEKLPAEALEMVLEDCAKRSDAALCARAEGLLREGAAGRPLLQSSYGALLRAKAALGDGGALELFEEVQRLDIRFGDSFYVSLMARCAEPKFLRFAEEVARALRARGGLTVSMYSALMKVYAFCGLYDKACDLYGELLEQRLEPDTVITTCVMRFAVEAGRKELLSQLVQKEPRSLQGCMLQIRAAGREKDVDGAFAILDRMRSAGLAVDSLACNSVLDVCVCAGDLARARGLLSEMRTSGLLDTVSFNTMLKGYCATGDMKGSQDLIAEMQRSGFKPDEVTYNCVINAAVSSGHLRLAWDMAWAMERSGVPMDRFTVSILLKAVKGQCSQTDVKHAMALLDRVGADVCASDAVLMNVALETCVKHRQLRRLQNLVHGWERSSLQPSTYTYAALIKAYSALQQVDRCQQLWRQMTEERGTEPSQIVLGCMLDALVCNGLVAEAVDLLKEWKAQVGANMVMYSTLIKGFAVAGMAGEAMDMWREIKAEGSDMNVVVYNSLIDAQARVGSMACAHELLTAMEEDGLSPDGITHSTMVKGYCTTGDLDKAFEVLRGTQKAGLVSDCVVYNTLLDACTRHNRVELADRVLADFERNGVRASNFTLGILVKMYGRRRQLSKAFDVLNDFAVQHNVTPNLQVRSCLMSVCINNGALDRALGIFDAIKRDGEGQVDAKTCDNVLGGLMRAGRLREAVAFVQEAYGLEQARLLPPGHHLSEQALERLVRGLQAKSLDAEGAALLSGLRAKGVSLNGRLLGLALRGH